MQFSEEHLEAFRNYLISVRQITEQSAITYSYAIQNAKTKMHKTAMKAYAEFLNAQFEQMMTGLSKPIVIEKEVVVVDEDSTKKVLSIENIIELPLEDSTKLKMIEMVLKE